MPARGTQVPNWLRPQPIRPLTCFPLLAICSIPDQACLNQPCNTVSGAATCALSKPDPPGYTCTCGTGYANVFGETFGGRPTKACLGLINRWAHMGACLGSRVCGSPAKTVGFVWPIACCQVQHPPTQLHTLCQALRAQSVRLATSFRPAHLAPRMSPAVSPLHAILVAVPSGACIYVLPRTPSVHRWMG
jgi:hypothetical protein